MNKTMTAAEKQIARFARQMAKESTKLRAAGLHEQANELVAKSAAAVQAARTQARGW